jgi:cytochrome c biogenesis protein CcmG, thiol:disulfide interchange protein DsbE
MNSRTPFNKIWVLPIVAFIFMVTAFVFIRNLEGTGKAVQPSPMMGKMLAVPDTLPLLDGTTTTLVALRQDKPLLINVFASWCAPCRLEMPLLKNLQQQHNVAIAGIAFQDAPDKIRTMLNTLNPFAHVIDDPQGTISMGLGLIGVPETYLLDKTGRVIWHHRGILTEKEMQTIVALL